MSDRITRVIICRAAPPIETMTPGSLLGYRCAICQTPLQLTPSGRALVISNPGSKLLCNECGLVVARMAEDSGHDIDAECGPEARHQLDRGNNSPLANWIRRRA